jgi:hypothetical protein
MARKALREEAEDYRVYLEVLTPPDLASVEALPFRRVLNKDFGVNLGRLGESMAVIGARSKEGPIPSHVLAFHTDYFQEPVETSAPFPEDVKRATLLQRGTLLLLVCCPGDNWAISMPRNH